MPCMQTHLLESEEKALIQNKFQKMCAQTLLVAFSRPQSSSSWRCFKYYGRLQFLAKPCPSPLAPPIKQQKLKDHEIFTTSCIAKPCMHQSYNITQPNTWLRQCDNLIRSPDKKCVCIWVIIKEYDNIISWGNDVGWQHWNPQPKEPIIQGVLLKYPKLVSSNGLKTEATEWVCVSNTGV